MLKDPWLDRWLPLAVERAQDRPVLEIGCGQGDDTATLARAGLNVIAFDLSRAAVAVARVRVPSAAIECRDIREPLPAQAQDLGVVVASLSLHYFAWKETVAIVQRVRHALRPGGLLLCRLISTEDRNFGAQGHPEIEQNFFLVDGEPKRFFDEESIALLFAEGWRRLSLEHFVTRKYVKSKAVWEVVLEKDA
ncbi:class I SAM-dependent methyltransferase [Schlegelella sp. S2-27]|uniref:Class I SAM-dependent methyltransferase n=1 Tax=Caldimonas mangrovi TaxID=2944811 RepID=A0ABT0YV95_9BURK|nr:class I SAM-dependent methyltransferase [Caldimonas mangrovi]MCM5682665.1 class I SAM-dependent methyltransferase [Caldimonas mangrovi]